MRIIICEPGASDVASDGKILVVGYWIEGGLKAGHIEESLKPEISSGLSTLVTQVNDQLKSLDALGKVSDVYYLPGTQTVDIATGSMTGVTEDDVTIVIEH